MIGPWLNEQGTPELRRNGIATLGFFFNIDRIPSFDIRHSVFDIRYSLFHIFDIIAEPLNTEPLNLRTLKL